MRDMQPYAAAGPLRGEDFPARGGWGGEQCGEKGEIDIDLVEYLE